MEDFERIALRRKPQPPTIWYRYGDDTLSILHTYNMRNSQHMNSIDPNIQFTSEVEEDSKITVLNILMTVL